jgi:hypothetical protein
MKVKELIEELEKWDGDDKVYTDNISKYDEPYERKIVHVGISKSGKVVLYFDE